MLPVHPFFKLLEAGVGREECILVLLRLALKQKRGLVAPGLSLMPRCVTCQDVPIAVVHPDIGTGTHGIGVEYCHSLSDWNNKIILIVLFPRTSEGFPIMRDADNVEIGLLNIFAFGLHVLQWPFATDSFFIFPVRYSICESSYVSCFVH